MNRAPSCISTAQRPRFEVFLNAVHHRVTFSPRKGTAEELHHARVGIDGCERLVVVFAPRAEDETGGGEDRWRAHLRLVPAFRVGAVIALRYLEIDVVYKLRNRPK
jgi:hypothetical protein